MYVYMYICMYVYVCMYMYIQKRERKREKMRQYILHDMIPDIVFYYYVEI